MELETLSAKWFTIYYTLVGIFLIAGGSYLAVKKRAVTNYLLESAEHEQPPGLPIKILKYFLFFTLPGLVFSFTPFSWIELLFTIWSLLLVYVAGIQLVRWKENRALVKASADRLPDLVGRSGAIMAAVGFALFLLAYLVIRQTPF